MCLEFSSLSITYAVHGESATHDCFCYYNYKMFVKLVTYRESLSHCFQKRTPHGYTECMCVCVFVCIRAKREDCEPQLSWETGLPNNMSEWFVTGNKSQDKYNLVKARPPAFVRDSLKFRQSDWLNTIKFKPSGQVTFFTLWRRVGECKRACKVIIKAQGKVKVRPELWWLIKWEYIHVNKCSHKSRKRVCVLVPFPLYRGEQVVTVGGNHRQQPLAKVTISVMSS